jgi:exopolysaccharide biosynthesis polyprenyl glycosylphosphotransferase
MNVRPRTAPRRTLPGRQGAPPFDERTQAVLEHWRKTAKIRRRGWLMHRVLLTADVFGLCLAVIVVELLFGSNGPRDRIDLTKEVLLFLSTLPLWIVGAKLFGLYDRDEERAAPSTTDDLEGVFLLATVGDFALIEASRLTGLAHPDLTKVAVFWAATIVCVTTARIAGRAVARRSMIYVQNAVIVGAGDVGQLVARKLILHREYGINLVGFVDAEPKEQRPDLEHLTILGDPTNLPELVELLDVERVIVAFNKEADGELIELIRALNALDVQIDIVPRFFDVLGPCADVHSVGGLPLLGLTPFRLSRWSRSMKRGMDVTGVAAGLVLFAPLLALIAFLVKLDSRGPVLFRQTRMGVGERTFEILKFRTMGVDAEARKAEIAHLNVHARDGGDPRMFKVPDDPRVTRIGRFLRRWSLDELPQLINVLKGEMSLVGPRPLILAEHRYVEEWAKKRLDLKPGVTGLWQTVGRSEIPFEEMVQLDYRYVTGWSLMTDVKLVLRTIPTLFRKSPAH